MIMIFIMDDNDDDDDDTTCLLENKIKTRQTRYNMIYEAKRMQ